jgi:transposase
MDFHLDTLLNLPNVTVFTCYQKEGFNILQLNLLNPKVSCNYCGDRTDEIHQERPILLRDLSICGQPVYLQVPRRQIYCSACQKYSTETLEFLEPGRKYTKRYEEYIYQMVKKLTVEQISHQEQLTAEPVKNIFSRLASRKKKTGQCHQD